MTCRVLFRLVLAGLVAIWASVASAQSLLPLRQGASITENGGPYTVTIDGRGANGTSFTNPFSVEFIVDVAVQRGHGEVMITVITEEQYNALVAMRKPENPQPPLKVILSGRDSASVALPKGNYFLAFNNTGTAPIQVTYRTSFVRGK